MFKQSTYLTIATFLGLSILGLSINLPLLANTKANTFIDNGNGSVTDTTTGLTWQQQANNAGTTHAGAIIYCQGLSLAGSSDWRLPNIKELASLVDYRVRNPAIDVAMFPNTRSRHWSASARTSSLAWTVEFFNGNVNFDDKSIINYLAQCVR